MVCWQSCFRWCCWCWFTGFRILCGLCLYALANDAKAVKKGGEMQFNGLGDVYRKTLQLDLALHGLQKGFNISCVGIMVYRGLYFGMYDSKKPVVLTGNLQALYLQIGRNMDDLQ